MRASRFVVGATLASALLIAGAIAPGPACAQSDDEFVALNRQVHEMLQAGKYPEALQIAEHYVATARKRHGEEHPAYASALTSLGRVFQATNRLSEAEPLYRNSLTIDEKHLGPENPDIARDLNNIALLLQETNRLAEAEPIFRRALAINEKSFGPEHPVVAIALSNLAQLLKDTNRLSEAEPLYRRALAIQEKSFGPEHPQVAPTLNNLALLLLASNQLAEAELVMRRAVGIFEKSFGTDHPNVATAINNLASVLQATNHPSEAELLYRRALAIHEKSLGTEHPSVATDLNNLAGLLQLTSRLSEAELFYRRAVTIAERSLGPENPIVARDLNNLALLLQATNRLAEAEPLFRRALAIAEKSYGPEHPDVATVLNNLALLLQAANRYADAEPLYRRALVIDEKSFGPEHYNIARDLNNQAGLLQTTNRLKEAEPLYRRTLVIFEKSFGPNHPIVANTLNNLAWLLAERGDWAEAVGLSHHAKPILIAHRSEGSDRSGLSRAALASNTEALRFYARAAHRADPDNAAAREESFELAQWALQTGAADALSQMSVRFAKGAGPLASVVRERQDLIVRRQSEMRRLDAAAGRADSKAGEDARDAVAALDQRLDAIDSRLAAEFPEYAQLANPKPLTIAEVQTLLRPDEALVVFLDVPKWGKLPEESLAWVVTKDTARWRSIALGTVALSQRVAALRCGLDRSSWDDASGWPRETALDKQRIAEQQARRNRCKQLLGLEVTPNDWPPFDPARAHELYQALLAPFADLIKGKQLIVAPSGPLTILPFHVLITDTPDAALTGMARYQTAAWLALQQPVTVLPSVGSLQSLRKLGPSQAAEPYIAFGNPLLTGPTGIDRSAWNKQTCKQDAKSRRVAEARSIARRGIGLRAIDLAELRTQEPLPETADELCAVAEALGAVGREGDTVWLGERATEHNLKALSREGKLARYRVVHFATHGLLSGESEVILKEKAEPALILTPPKDGTPASELDEDNGLLTASEVAQLELDADWVVLSACNTAAGEKDDAEALSGLARAFFYAKARALLVSHWPVNSDAAVKLTTKAFAELKAHPEIGRAEALRRSMAVLIKNGPAEYAHPAVWAPFVLVGEGAGARQVTASSPLTAIATPTPAASARPKKRTTAPDWRTDLWRR